MFTYNYSDDIIPTLTFTKAELVYIVSVILSDLKPTDDHTKIEMVELRHYVNKIRDKVVLAAHQGTLKEQTFGTEEPKEEKKKEEEKKKLPSIKELKEKFPTLAESEIEEIIRNAKERFENNAGTSSTDGNTRTDNVLSEGKHNSMKDKAESQSSKSFRIENPISPMHNEAIKFSKLLGS
ncbi:MAG: hypothetical protein J6Q22_10945 [Prevotella sp.]|nr:hypothetical protein [Prevotella sp.]